jgi:tetratricopeptide (TPR) repeat protein
VGYLLNQLSSYRQIALAAYAQARPLAERVLAIYEKALGPDHPHTATSLNNLGGLLDSQGDLAGARSYYEQALAIRQRTHGPDHPDTALSLNNLGYLIKAQGDLAEPGRTTSERWRSVKRGSAPIIRTQQRVSTISAPCYRRRATLRERGRITGALWRSVKRRLAPIILTRHAASIISAL